MPVAMLSFRTPLSDARRDSARPGGLCKWRLQYVPALTTIEVYIRCVASFAQQFIMARITRPAKARRDTAADDEIVQDLAKQPEAKMPRWRAQSDGTCCCSLDQSPA